MTRNEGSAAAGALPESPQSTRMHLKRWLREHLGWSRLYRSASYLRSTLWVVPLLAVVLERATYRLLQFVEQWVTWDLTDLGVDGARALFQTLITLTLSFIVFSFGSLLVALQVASAQLTPRIIATTLLRDPVIKYSVGLNVFTLLFAVSGLEPDGIDRDSNSRLSSPRCSASLAWRRSCSSSTMRHDCSAR